MNDLTPIDTNPGTTLMAEDVYVFDEGASKGDIIYELSSRIPVNEFGLPIFYLRGDLLPSGTHLTQTDVDVAAQGLFYYEGYPTTERGGSFWNQLPHEPHNDYELFRAYLDQAALIGVRQLDLLAADAGKTLEVVSEACRAFYWSARARAFDMFIVAADRKKREHRIRNMEDSHYLEADALFKKVLERFKGDNSDWIDELNAKEAIEVMETLVKLQRMSVGLTGQKASSTPADALPGESSEAIMRQIAQRATQTGTGNSDFGSQLNELLNGSDGAQIQDLIIRFTSPNNKQAFSEEQ